MLAHKTRLPYRRSRKLFRVALHEHLLTIGVLISWTKARLMKPRMVCGCHLVTRMISAIEAPLGRCNIRMTCAFLVPTRMPVVFDRGRLLRDAWERAVERADPFARAFQMRSRAVLRSVKRWTGVIPGRPFQRRTRRDADHCVVR